MAPEVPLLLHLVGFALWFGGASAEAVLYWHLRRRREWKEREAVVAVVRDIDRFLEIPAMVLAVAGGIWLLVAIQPTWPPPRWLYVKIHLTFAPLVASLGGLVFRAKLRRVVEASLTAPSPANEDRYEGLLRAYLLAGVVFFGCMVFIVALAAVKPNW